MFYIFSHSDQEFSQHETLEEAKEIADTALIADMLINKHQTIDLFIIETENDIAVALYEDGSNWVENTRHEYVGEEFSWFVNLIH